MAVSRRPTEQFHKPVKRLVHNMEDISRLLAIHRDLTGPARGRRHKVEVLHKGAIVLLVASWEAFVKDLVSAGFDFLLKKSNGPDQFTAWVRNETLNTLGKDEHWKLAKDGWKNVMRDARPKILERIKGMKSPTPGNVNSMLNDVLGIPNASRRWRLGRSRPLSAAARLDRLIGARHKIAHRNAIRGGVRKDYVERSVTLIGKLGAACSNQVASKLATVIGRAPWDQIEWNPT